MASKKELPGYLRNTKSAERYFGVYEEDVVRYAFLPTSFVQLRKLPAKLKAGMIEEIRSEKPTRAAKPWQTESSLQGYAIYNMDSVSPRQSEMRKKLLGTVEGTLSPRRHTIAPKTFSSFAHIPNDYDFERQQRAAERAAKEAKIIGPKSMKTGVPVTLDKQGSFTHFRYESEPYQSRIETFHSASSASTSVRVMLHAVVEVLTARDLSPAIFTIEEAVCARRKAECKQRNAQAQVITT